MTRAKTKPTMHKPVFDAEGILSFAAQGVHTNGHEPDPAASDHDRLSITLALKSDVIARLKAEAARKEKTLEQIVEKLVSKHLNKH